MDRIIGLLIRLIVALSALAKPLSALGIGTYREWKPGETLRLLLVGYNGARNTGADARVAAIVRQLKTLFGAEEVEITVMTLDETTLEGYFDADVVMREFSSIFLLDLLRACSSSHAAILCEGSTLKSTFANALTLFFCEASGIMAKQGKPCIAYGSEVGEMEPFLKRMAMRMCRETYFITRTEKSYEALTALGLRGHVGTDTAWCYDGAVSPQEADALLRGAGWDGKKPLLGAAVIDPFCWPVRASMTRWIRGMVTGNREGRYDKWYFFSDSPRRRAAYEEYIHAIAQAVERFAQERDAFPVLIGMERLDEKACRALRAQLSRPCAMFCSGRVPAGEMTGILRKLSWLVTSRYHAAVLSMDRGIPLVAVSMDERLDGILTELDFQEDYLYHVDDTDLGERIYEALYRSDAARGEIRERIGQQCEEYRRKLDGMGQFLKAYVRKEIE